ncbi:Histone chaperone like protein [Verticillium longisporum]|nr:Histone chaperone like protein [Verticillium longisporum]
MAPGLDIQRLGVVFQSRPDILEGIQREANSASRVTLFNDIASFVYEQTNGPEPAAKRRRVDVDASNGFKASNGNRTINVAGSVPASAAEAAVDEPVQLEIKEISVSVPQRKKFELCFTDNHLYARVPGTTTPAAGIAYAWGDIEYAFYLPIPEKTQVQHNYIIFPRGACLPSKTETAIPTAEPLVFTVPASAPKQGTILGPKASSAAAVSDTYRSLFDWALTTHLRAASNPINIVSADPAKFHSMVRQPHRPNEKAVHVKAFRGSKDGYLFFLPTGILWGFKKPLLFIPLERISSLSYTSVLQRTFNIVVEAFTGEGDATEELEFAMLDQEDYQGIDESYAGKKAAGAGDVAPEAGADTDGRTELEKAQAEAELQLQDEEDEDEEDYDPGSEGESEGSGVSSDEDDEDDDQEMEGGEDDEQDDAGDESINVKG